jgi:hypothetical protein
MGDGAMGDGSDDNDSGNSSAGGEMRPGQNVPVPVPVPMPAPALVLCLSGRGDREPQHHPRIASKEYRGTRTGQNRVGSR